MATLVCNTDRATVAENNMVEDRDVDEVAGPAEAGIPGGHELAGVAECEADGSSARATEHDCSTVTRLVPSLAPLSSCGTRCCLWPEDQRQR